MKKLSAQPFLFDTAPLPAPPQPSHWLAPETCPHSREEKTETNWGREPWPLRMTWTCLDCGNVRGRC